MFYSPIIQTLISNPDHHLDVLRLDLIDKEVSGNKWFKLKYNLEAAMKLGDQQIITFGGAFSNARNLISSPSSFVPLEVVCEYAKEKEP
jgi:1-aminocyclopropane-1-carboxylate deaminase/D-cysteine desulfhydrase-like pyridoxal-dependent ACC family enzyme